MCRIRVVATAGPVILAAGLASAPAGAAPAPTCQGHRATNVAAPGPTVSSGPADGT
jgi:hypothetical protein